MKKAEAISLFNHIKSILLEANKYQKNFIKEIIQNKENKSISTNLNVILIYNDSNLFGLHTIGGGNLFNVLKEECFDFTKQIFNKIGNYIK